MSRIDAATAEMIQANNAQRARSQTPMPASDAAVQRLIEGILADKPNYEQMSPFFAEVVRKEGFICRLIYTKRGPVPSIEFRHVDRNGGDVYEVRQDGGFSTWVIYLNPTGPIEDAEDSSG